MSKKPFDYELTNTNCPFCNKPIDHRDCIQGGNLIYNEELTILLSYHHACEEKCEKATVKNRRYGQGCVGVWIPKHGLAVILHYEKKDDETVIIF